MSAQAPHTHQPSHALGRTPNLRHKATPMRSTIPGDLSLHGLLCILTLGALASCGGGGGGGGVGGATFCSLGPILSIGTTSVSTTANANSIEIQFEEAIQNPNWFRFYPPEDAIYSISVCPSGWDSYIGVTDSCSIGISIANDDAFPEYCGWELASSLDGFFESGIEYRICIGGFGPNDYGGAEVTIDFASAPTPPLSAQTGNNFGTDASSAQVDTLAWSGASEDPRIRTSALWTPAEQELVIERHDSRKTTRDIRLSLAVAPGWSTTAKPVLAADEQGFLIGLIQARVNGASMFGGRPAITLSRFDWGGTLLWSTDLQANLPSEYESSIAIDELRLDAGLTALAWTAAQTSLLGGVAKKEHYRGGYVLLSSVNGALVAQSNLRGDFYGDVGRRSLYESILGSMLRNASNSKRPEMALTFQTVDLGIGPPPTVTGAERRR